MSFDYQFQNEKRLAEFSTPATRYQANIAALRVLKQIKAENRAAATFEAGAEESGPALPGSGRECPTARPSQPAGRRRPRAPALLRGCVDSRVPPGLAAQ